MAAQWIEQRFDCILDEIQGVWIADETLCRVFDIVSIETKLRSKRRNKTVKIYTY